MPTLGLAMIVKNESAWLKGCLESAAPICDFLYIGDTGSTDDTAGIAASFNATVFEIPWTDNFAAARNAVLKRVATDWVLQLDADETLDADGAARIRAIVDLDGDGADAIEVTQANYCSEMRGWRWTPVNPATPKARGHVGYLAAPVIRLFRNHMGIAYRDAVHETVAASVEAVGAVARPEPILIHHYGYAPTSERGREKARLYYGIAKQKVADAPDDPKAWFDMAEQALSVGEAGEAEEAAREAVRLAPAYVDAEMCLAKLLLNRGDLDGAAPILRGLVAREEGGVMAITGLAAILLRRGSIADALSLLQHAVAIHPGHPLARQYFAEALDRAGDTRAALQQLDAAVTIAPGVAELSKRLEAYKKRLAGEEAFSRGESSTALQLLVESLRLNPEDAITHNNLGVVAAALGRHDEARRSFERALRLAPELTSAAENLGQYR